MKLIQSLGKSIYADRWKIRKNMSSSLVLLTSKDHSCAGKLNKLLQSCVWEASVPLHMFKSIELISKDRWSVS